MQDFAKYRRFEREELEGVEPDWSLDPISVLFGALLGAIVIFAGLKASEDQEMQPTDDYISEDTSAEGASMQFEFYTELKREGLYPAFSE